MYTKEQALNYLKSLNGRAVDFDGYYGYQCMDLSVDYIYRLSEGKIRLWGNAIDIPRNSLPEGWKIVKNTPSYIPPIGAVVVWSGGYFSSYGHTAIVWDNSGGLKSMVVLEQNWDSKASSPAKLRTDYYNYVQYFLVPPMLTDDKVATKPRFTAPQKKPVANTNSVVGTKVPKTLKWTADIKFTAKSDYLGVTVAKRTGKAGNYRYVLTNLKYPANTTFYVYQVQDGWARVYSATSNYWVWHERLIITKDHRS